MQNHVSMATQNEETTAHACTALVLGVFRRVPISGQQEVGSKRGSRSLGVILRDMQGPETWVPWLLTTTGLRSRRLDPQICQQFHNLSLVGVWGVVVFGVSVV